MQSENIYWTTTPTMSQDVYPSYRFHSTSSYTYTTSAGSADNYVPISTAQSAPRKMRYWDEEEEEIGVINTPVGEPTVLMVMVLIYTLFTFTKSYIHRKKIHAIHK